MSIKVVEVGLRDGLQNEKKIVPTDLKKAILKKLLQAGISHIEVTSFVHPKWIPQLKDAEDLLFDLPKSDATFSALVPNCTGYLRASTFSLDEIAVFLSASETHNLKNVNSKIDESFLTIKEVIQAAKKDHKRVRGYISCVFGCPYEGEVPISNVVSLCERFVDMGVDEISLGDTIGVATPNKVKEVLSQLFRQFTPALFAMHFHDTRGMGIVNAYASLECGILTMDTSFGGLGGCPYAPGASGNLATEDLVYLLEGLGFNTGIDVELLANASQQVGEFLGKKLPSKVLQTMISLNEGAIK